MIGNEIVSGDVENTNGSWLARTLAELGIEVRLLAALRDEIAPVGRRCQAGALHAAPDRGCAHGA